MRADTILNIVIPWNMREPIYDINIKVIVNINVT